MALELGHMVYNFTPKYRLWPDVFGQVTVELVDSLRIDAQPHVSVAGRVWNDVPMFAQAKPEK